MYFNLNDSASSSSKKKRKAEGGSDTEEETKAKDNKIRQKVRKLCEGNADAYIYWMKQMDSIIKGKPCDTTKSKFAIVSVMLYGDLMDSCGMKT